MNHIGPLIAALLLLLSVAVEALPDATVALRVEPSTGLLAGASVTAFIDYGNSGFSPLVNPVLRLDLDPSVLLSDGSGGTGPIPTPLDQCINDADQAALEAIATEEQSGAAVVGMIAGECPLDACTAELGGVLSDSSEAARNALGDCIAQCISDRTGLSAGCTGCYGSIAACSTAFCVAPCLPPNSGSPECASCALENCIDVNACTGL